MAMKAYVEKSKINLAKKLLQWGLNWDPKTLGPLVLHSHAYLTELP